MIVDCVTYSETLSYKQLEKNTKISNNNKNTMRGASWKAKTGLSDLELSAIEGCVQRDGVSSVTQDGVKVVTIDWVVHCLQVRGSNLVFYYRF